MKHISIRSTLLIIGLLATYTLSAQSSLEKVLSEIAKNNKSIQANQQYWESQKLLYKTGITPYNPTVEYDYLSGSPAGAGNQTDFSIAQAFDFPTAYVKKNQMANQQIKQAGSQMIATRQNVLFDAQKVCIELIYQNKLQSHLTFVKRNNERLLSDFQSKLKTGEGNALDVNKTQLQLIEIRKELQACISSIAQLNAQLTSLNGGTEISFTDTVYSPAPALLSFEELEKEYESKDPLRIILEEDKSIALKQLGVSKAMWLPKIELGYHYQAILGQTYQGLHTGINIPLWENKNTVKLQKSKILFADLELQNHRNEHYYEIKQLYEKQSNLNITLNEYQTIFKSMNNSYFLNKALALGQISTIEYFIETNYYNRAFNNYLETEKEYYETVAALYKYQL